MVWDPKAIGQLGGRSRSASKQQAARKNGAKGGRPPKKPDKGSSRVELRKYAVYYVVQSTEKFLESGHIYLDFWPLSEKEVRKELIRRGRRDLWKKLLQRLESKPSITLTDKQRAEVIAEIRAKRAKEREQIPHDDADLLRDAEVRATAWQRRVKQDSENPSSQPLIPQRNKNR